MDQTTNETTTNHAVTPGPWDIAKVESMAPDMAYSEFRRAKQALADLRNVKPREDELVAYGNACAVKAELGVRLDAAPAKAGGARGPKRESASVDDVCSAITKLYVAGTNGVKTKAIEAACDGKSIGAGLKAGLDKKLIEVKNMGKGAAGGNFYKPVAKAPEKASQREEGGKAKR